MRNPLNEVDGNIMAYNAQQSDTNAESHKDLYKCDCGVLVLLKDWNEEYKMCVDCYMDMCQDQAFRWGEPRS